MQINRCATDAVGHCGGEKKNDRVDAQKICDCLRCDFLRR